MIGISGATVVVTGGGGFIGRAVVKALAGAGAHVKCLTGPPGCGLQAPAGAVESFESDVCDSETLSNYARGAAIIVHLAGMPSVAQSFEEPCEYVRVHVQGTASVLEASRRATVPRLIYVSSAEVYGCPVSNPVREDHRVQPRSPYAAAKSGAEALVEAWHRSFQQSAIVLRPFSIYGAGASQASLISRILQQIRVDDSIVLADLRPVRDYCFVEDFARAVLCSCIAPIEYGVFNVGTMQGTSVGDLARLLRMVTGSDAQIREDASRGRPSDILELIADNGRATSLLGWRPEVDLVEGLTATAAGARLCAS